MTKKHQPRPEPIARPTTVGTERAELAKQLLIATLRIATLRGDKLAHIANAKHAVDLADALLEELDK